MIGTITTELGTWSVLEFGISASAFEGTPPVLAPLTIEIYFEDMFPNALVDALYSGKSLGQVTISLQAGLTISLFERPSHGGIVRPVRLDTFVYFGETSDSTQFANFRRLAISLDNRNNEQPEQPL